MTMGADELSPGEANAPKVSIAMPVYNGELFLADAIESHLAQTYEDFELVICDNASDDDTPAIAERYCNKDSRVRYRRNDSNVGANQNFNIGFRETTGEYLRWAAGDDTVEPTYLERTVAVLDSRPDVVLAHAKSNAIDRYGEPLVPLKRGFVDPDGFVEPFRYESASSQWLEKDRPSERIRSVIRNTHRLSFVFGLIRREAVEQTLLHRSFYGADKVLLFELLLQGKIVELDERLFNRRSHHLNSNRLDQSSEEMKQFGAGDRVFVARVFHAYISAIQASDMSSAEKARCLAVIGGKIKTPLRTWQGR